MRVLLISTFGSSRPAGLNPGRFSLGLLSLAAYAEGRVPGVEVHVRVYGEENLDRLSWLGEALALRPDVIGFTCWFWNVEAVLRTCRAIRGEVLPEARLVLGGPQVSSVRYAERLLRANPAVDAIVRGEGEGPLAALLEAVAADRPLAGIPGVSAREGDAIRHAPDAEPLADLDAIPRVFAEPRERALRAAISHGHVSYQTYRGCRRACRFCAYHGGGLRLLPLERVAEELAFILRRLRPRRLRIVDAHLGGPRERALRILEVLATHNAGTEIQAFHDLRHLDAAYLAACERAGALTGGTAREFGLQSSSDEVLRRMGRRDGLETFARGMAERRAYAAARGRPFRAVAEYMIGLPDDTYAGVLRTIGDAVAAGATHVRGYPLQVLPGSPYYDEAEQWGLVHTDEGSFRVLRTPTMTGAEIHRLTHVARLAEVLDEVLPRTYAQLRSPPERFAGALERCLDRYLDRVGDRDPYSFALEGLFAAVDESVRGDAEIAERDRQRLQQALAADVAARRGDASGS